MLIKTRTDETQLDLYPLLISNAILLVWRNIFNALFSKNWESFLSCSCDIEASNTKHTQMQLNAKVLNTRLQYICQNCRDKIWTEISNNSFYKMISSQVIRSFGLLTSLRNDRLLSPSSLYLSSLHWRNKDR